MKKLLFISTCLLALLVMGCKEELPPLDGVEPYGIIEDVRWFTIDSWFPGSWINASDNWEYEQHEGFVPETMIEKPYRGWWTIFLDGPACNLSSHKERYEQICLEWGVRIDNEEVESEALANVSRLFPNGEVSGGHIVANHGISGMDLITESDFDAEHPAGSSLADITLVGNPSLEYAFNGEPRTVDFYNARIRMCDVDESTYKRIEPAIQTQIARNPQKAGEYVFRQIIYFADGKVVQRRFKRIWLEEHLNLDPLKPLP